MSCQTFIDSIIDAMKEQIQKHSLSLLQRYPDDLLVIDRARLERYAVPGATIAWMVGHSHTHMAILGLHPEENEAVSYYTNLSNEDRFYTLKINGNTVAQTFVLAEISRAKFNDLSRFGSRYTRKGEVTGFQLFIKNRSVGYISLQSVGTFHKPIYKASITPVFGASLLDRTALKMWCEKSVIEAAHTLFVQYEIVEENPIHLLAAA